MSGSNQGGTPPAKPGADPAMDDILASIRRILNEDEVPPGAATQPAIAPPPPAPPPVAAAPPPAEPIDLTPAMMVAAPIDPPPAPPPWPPAELRVEMSIGSAEPTPMPQLAAAPATPAVAEPVAAAPAADALVAPAVAAATTAAMGQLLRTVAAERASPVHRGGPSIEDVVREELRPLLKAWLDQHLPPLVERLVRAEIERVVSRAM